ncbi:FG-GAP repeat protein [Streptomyces sp. NPDC052701]|uniref:FG-GAP repeat protein n=1 Tax=Streptomyces sp. NPDC052701 TaxID=3155533 RepID=UPI0034337999
MGLTALPAHAAPGTPYGFDASGSCDLDGDGRLDLVAGVPGESSGDGTTVDAPARGGLVAVLAPWTANSNGSEQPQDDREPRSEAAGSAVPPLGVRDRPDRGRPAASARILEEHVHAARPASRCGPRPGRPVRTPGTPSTPGGTPC